MMCLDFGVVSFWVIVLVCKTITNIIDVCLQVSDSPLCGYDGVEC